MASHYILMSELKVPQNLAGVIQGTDGAKIMWVQAHTPAESLVLGSRTGKITASKMAPSLGLVGSALPPPHPHLPAEGEAFSD